MPPNTVRLIADAVLIAFLLVCGATAFYGALIWIPEVKTARYSFIDGFLIVGALVVVGSIALYFAGSVFDLCVSRRSGRR